MNPCAIINPGISRSLRTETSRGRGKRIHGLQAAGDVIKSRSTGATPRTHDDGTSAPLRVLIVEDSQDDAELLLHELRSGGFDVAYAVITTEQQLVKELREPQWDLVISDYSMPSFDGLRCLRLCQEHGLEAPFILVSGTVGEELAVDAMRAGAHDYVMKQNPSRLVPAIRRELRDAQIRRENRRMAEHIEFIAYHDPVTDLPNERLFKKNLTKILEGGAEGEHVVAVAVLEIGNLRSIRNVLGVETADALMGAIAERLMTHAGDATRVGRLNESSFGLTAELRDDTDLEAFGSRCTEIFDEPIELEISRLHVDPTIGIAAYPGHGRSGEAVLRSAYVASTHAAERSTHFRVYSPAEDRATPERLQLLGELRHAVRNDDLVLLYQPIVELASGSIVAAEALVRWQHPDRGLITPAMFLEGAEQSGLIRPLTDWVIRNAFEQLARWKGGGGAVPLFVNLSVRDLESPGLPGYVRKCLQETPVDPPSIGFEVTESAIMHDYAVANRVLRELHDMGFVIAIDDFGAGYTSLRYLHRLPIDHLKVDRSFITSLAPGSDGFTIVKAMLDLAASLGLSAVAEGVERRETMELLREMGCPLAQGYLFSRPVNAHRMEELLARRTDPPWRANGSTSTPPAGTAR